MVENINDISVNQILKPVKTQENRTLIDSKELKEILFLGVQGDLSIVKDDSEVDFLV